MPEEKGMDGVRAAAPNAGCRRIILITTGFRKKAKSTWVALAVSTSSPPCRCSAKRCRAGYQT